MDTFHQISRELLGVRRFGPQNSILVKIENQTCNFSTQAFSTNSVAPAIFASVVETFILRLSTVQTVDLSLEVFLLNHKPSKISFSPILSLSSISFRVVSYLQMGAKVYEASQLRTQFSRFK